MERLLTVNEVADVLGVSRGQVYRLIATSGLPAIRVGSVLRFSPAEVNHWMDKRKERV